MGRWQLSVLHAGCFSARDPRVATRLIFDIADYSSRHWHFSLSCLTRILVLVEAQVNFQLKLPRINCPSPLMPTVKGPNTRKGVGLRRIGEVRVEEPPGE